MLLQDTGLMLFISPVFLLYFLPVFLLLYSISPRWMKNWVLLLASLVFYAWGAPRFIFVVLLTTLVDFQLVRIMSRQQNPSRRKGFLIASLSLNLGLLAYFKYMNFFVDNGNALLRSLGFMPGPSLHILLPIGISFFVFESITYVVDVYRREQEPLKNFGYYLLYIFFFPKMIAGPIVRYGEIAGQIEGRLLRKDPSLMVTGFGRFVTGLAKKVVIADVLGVYTQAVMLHAGGGVDAFSAWIGMLAFAMQIYFDFSGYSDMAIGLANMMGFHIGENFYNPFTASSVTEFWKRWHMSFTRWMKQYLYIPLGGNRVSRPRLYFNLWLVFFLSGLWHGAAWNYILWGILHGCLLIAERLFLGRFWQRTGRWLSIPVTFFLVVALTLMLKTTDMRVTWSWYTALWSPLPEAQHIPLMSETLYILIVAVFFSLFTLLPYGGRIQRWWYSGWETTATRILKPLLWVVLFIFCMGYVAGHDFKTFIYFMF